MRPWPPAPTVVPFATCHNSASTDVTNLVGAGLARDYPHPQAHKQVTESLRANRQAATPPPRTDTGEHLEPEEPPDAPRRPRTEQPAPSRVAAQGIRMGAQAYRPQTRPHFLLPSR